YRCNRHNVGFMVIDSLSEKTGIRLTRVKSKAIIGSGNFGNSRLLLAKPQTFMNLSGESVFSLARFYKVPMNKLLIIHDDLDLPFGTIRMRASGGAGGQKGLASIIAKFASNDFPRLRIGIGRPPGKMNPADYVLQNFPKNEIELLGIVITRSVEAVQLFLQQGIEQAMNNYNGSYSDD
ncbi:MAG: aminoacyl-tRNA hydrolase, partial [Anaerolineaceae bacterium]|nr:aminoacyl-tRNA hydrolase [Anaerolineaceae bacterium]